MAFHESHERPCPHCGERMSATAPRCLNCGRYVDEDNEDDEPGGGRSKFFVATGMVLAIIVGAVVVFLLV